MLAVPESIAVCGSDTALNLRIGSDSSTLTSSAMPASLQ